MRIPLAIAVLSTALGVAGLVLAGGLAASDLIVYALGVSFTATGVVIAVRRPGNRVGWLFLFVGLGAALAIFSGSLADQLVGDGGTAGEIAATYGSASWAPMMLPELTFLLLLFPDGHLLPGPRWRWVARLTAAAIAVVFVAQLTFPGPLEDYPQIDNPLGVQGADAIQGLGFLLLFGALVACPAALIVRYRRADGATREQIKWLAFAGAVAAAVFVLGLLLINVLSDGVVYGAMMGAVVLIPVAAAVAILRYRLYDIELVINRALVYTALTATLVAAYLVTVVLSQLVLPARSDLGVALSTLAAIAVFTPARRRIQASVDRRFFRRRYDAQQTLDAFGAQLRDEVDLDALSGELRGVVAETMQPAHVSLWLR